jgi:hypothetical protein
LQHEGRDQLLQILRPPSVGGSVALASHSHCGRLRASEERSYHRVMKDVTHQVLR